MRAAFTRPAWQADPVDALQERVRARLLAEPERYRWRYFIVAALLTRR